jgi:hypothetical protein
MELNGKTSSGKRTRHFNIKYYYVTDLIARGLISIEYCPTNEMIADYMTKPMVGTKFNKFREQILGHIPIVGQQECVGDLSTTIKQGKHGIDSPYKSKRHQ